MSQFKNIIFDLGGVILNIDYLATIRTFESLGLKNADEKFSQAKQGLIFDKLDKGEISGYEFIKELRTYFEHPVSASEISDAWNVMLLDLPKERLKLLETLKENYSLFLLSNTNEIHIPEYHKYLQKTYGFHDLSHIFSKQYYSFEMGMRKPDVEIFEFVTHDQNLVPHETLFIDDSVQHLEGAKKAGLKTYWLQKGETILDIFPKVLES